MLFSKGRDPGSTLLGRQMLFKHSLVTKAIFRNFAATQTKGVRNSVYNKFSSKAEAEGAYREALEEGYVEVL